MAHISIFACVAFWLLLFVTVPWGLILAVLVMAIGAYTCGALIGEY